MDTIYFVKFYDNGLPKSFIPSFTINNIEKEKLISEGYIEISFEEYNYYIGNMSNKENNYAKYKRDSETGKPVVYVPPEPTKEEKQISSINSITNDTQLQAEELKNAMITAILNDDTELQEELKQEYKSLMTNSSEQIQGVIEND